jgi:hypothetical protein
LKNDITFNEICRKLANHKQKSVNEYFNGVVILTSENVSNVSDSFINKQSFKKSCKFLKDEYSIMIKTHEHRKASLIRRKMEYEAKDKEYNDYFNIDEEDEDEVPEKEKEKNVIEEKQKPKEEALQNINTILSDNIKKGIDPNVDIIKDDQIMDGSHIMEITHEDNSTENTKLINHNFSN